MMPFCKQIFNDFKFDNNPIVGKKPNFERLKEIVSLTFGSGDVPNLMNFGKSQCTALEEQNPDSVFCNLYSELIDNYI